MGTEKQLTEQKNVELRLTCAFFYFLNADWGASLAKFGEPGFSGDGANLYTVVTQGDKKSLVKVAWGEFSKPVFETPEKTKYPDSAKLFQLLAQQLPLYCVGQHDSYLVSEIDELAKQMQENPAQYLAEKSIFMAGPQGVFVGTKAGIGLEKVQAVPYNQALQVIRTLALSKWKDLISVLQTLPNFHAEADRCLKGEVRTKLLYTFGEAMGLWHTNEFVGMRIGEFEPIKIERLIDLKHHFNFEAGSFEQEIVPPHSVGHEEPPGLV